MTSVVVLQARTNSTRLPAKVLLPINGIPIVALAAKRAGNTGKQVIVATSNEASDDLLASIVSAHGLRCFRGSLDDTLKRFVDALADFDDDTIVFRLTSDNIFPDGEILDQLEHEFIANAYEYLCLSGEESGLPYGLGAEVTRLWALREAHDRARAEYDREHVTPYVIRKFGKAYFDRYRDMKLSGLRCTIDVLDDYLNVCAVMESVPDPLHVSAIELARRLSDAQPKSRRCTKLVLGSAQFGMNYGIANSSGKPDVTVVRKILELAIARGVDYIDTARGYGASEQVIGDVLPARANTKIVTKISPLSQCGPETNHDVVEAFVDSDLFRSRLSLKREPDIVLLHRAAHLLDWDGTVWNRLRALKAQGIIGAIGVSVQNPGELQLALSQADVDHIQLPFNILDHRWDAAIGRIRETRQEREITIHARSALLQGLLCSRICQLWQQANVEEPDHIIGWIDRMARETGSEIPELCIRFVRSMDWVDGVVVGIDNYEQFQDIIRYFDEPPFDSEALERIIDSRPVVGESVLNPALWQGK